MVRYLAPARGSATCPRQYEAIRIRLVWERQVVQGRFLTAQGHREPGSVRARVIRQNWDATVCEAAIQYARRRVSQWQRPGRRQNRKTKAILAVAQALHLHRAPVNHHVASALMSVLDLRCSRVWFNRTLRGAGWRPLEAHEYPRDALGFDLTNWVPGP